MERSAEEGRKGPGTNVPHSVNPLRLVSGIGWGSVHNYTQPFPRNPAPRRVMRKTIQPTGRAHKSTPRLRSVPPGRQAAKKVLSNANGVNLFLRTGIPVSRIEGSDTGYSLPSSFWLSTVSGPQDT